MISRLRQNRRRRRCRQMAEAKRTMLLTENPLPSAAMAMDRHRKAMPLWVVSVTSVAALPDPTRWNTPKKMIMKVNCFWGFFVLLLLWFPPWFLDLFVTMFACLFFFFPRFVYISVSCIRLRGRVREQSFNPLCLNGWFLSKVQFIYFF